MMHGLEKSDPAIVAMKPVNNGGLTRKQASKSATLMTSLRSPAIYRPFGWYRGNFVIRRGSPSVCAFCAMRIGRLLISALLEHWKLLPEPLLYLSGYLKRYQTEYYRRLSVIRTEGDWEAWVSFFLEGVAAVASEAEQSIIAIASLVAADRRKLLQSPKSSPASYRLFEQLPMMPRFTVERARQQLDTTFPTANSAVRILEHLGILVEVTGQKKNRSYSYQAYVDVLAQQ